MKNIFENLAKKAFSENEHLQELFATEDGNLFTKEANAKQHNRIVNGSIHHFTRNEPVAKEKTSEKSVKETVSEEVNEHGQTVLEDTISEAQILDLSYADLKNMVAELNLEVADLKKITLLEALKQHFKF